MTSRVMPLVRLVLPVGKALIDLADESWVLRDPLAVVHLPTVLDVEPGPRLAIKATAFAFRNIPFREEGSYEFRVVAQTNDFTPPTYESLNGAVAELRVLNPRGKL